MSRRLQLLWIPLLAALIAGPPATRAFENLGSTDVLRAGASIVSAPFYSLPTARSVPAVQSGPRPYRHGGPSWAGVPVHLVTSSFEHRLLAVATWAGSDGFARTARHFPLFPTGPPAHGWSQNRLPRRPL